MSKLPGSVKGRGGWGRVRGEGEGVEAPFRISFLILRSTSKRIFPIQILENSLLRNSYHDVQITTCKTSLELGVAVIVLITRSSINSIQVNSLKTDASVRRTPV